MDARSEYWSVAVLFYLNGCKASCSSLCSAGLWSDLSGTFVFFCGSFEAKLIVISSNSQCCNPFERHQQYLIEQVCFSCFLIESVKACYNGSFSLPEYDASLEQPPRGARNSAQLQEPNLHDHQRLSPGHVQSNHIAGDWSQPFDTKHSTWGGKVIWRTGRRETDTIHCTDVQKRKKKARGLMKGVAKLGVWPLGFSKGEKRMENALNCVYLTLKFVCLFVSFFSSFFFSYCFKAEGSKQKKLYQHSLVCVLKASPSRGGSPGGLWAPTWVCFTWRPQVGIGSQW